MNVYRSRNNEESAVGLLGESWRVVYGNFRAQPTVDGFLCIQTHRQRWMFPECTRCVFACPKLSVKYAVSYLDLLFD